MMKNLREKKSNKRINPKRKEGKQKMELQMKQDKRKTENHKA
jgi:hypothetical protein